MDNVVCTILCCPAGGGDCGESVSHGLPRTRGVTTGQGVPPVRQGPWIRLRMHTHTNACCPSHLFVLQLIDRLLCSRMYIICPSAARDLLEEQRHLRFDADAGDTHEEDGYAQPRQRWVPPPKLRRLIRYPNACTYHIYRALYDISACRGKKGAIHACHLLMPFCA